ncbi:MAG: carbon-nitrogen hydrolase family protein, partial [Candidatus Methanomethylophilaceae archaeon]
RAYVFTPEGTFGYRKIHLPGFGSFAEDRIFTPGKEITSFGFRGHRFGLSICYDIFFPEILKTCSHSMGTDVNICISASPVASQPFFERILPARALENTSYLLFVNNIGTIGDFEFFGGTRALAPDGDLIRMSFEECVKIVEISPDVVESIRKGRPVLKDTVFECVRKDRPGDILLNNQ